MTVGAVALSPGAGVAPERPFKAKQAGNALLVAGDLIIHGTYHFVGGTGRFAGASGRGAIDAVASLALGLPFTGTMNGTIDC
jgi:hypothetical protein